MVIKKTKKQESLLEEEFVRTIAHDMKSKLTSMQAYTQLLERRLKTDNKDSVRFLTSIETHIKSFTDITTDVTDLLKYTSSKCNVNREIISLDHFIEHMSETLKKTKPTHNITKKKISGISLSVDKARFEKVLTNILAHCAENVEKIIIEGKQDTAQCIITIEKQYKEEKNESPTIFEQIKLLVAEEIINLHNGKLTIDTNGKRIIYQISVPVTASLES